MTNAEMIVANGGAVDAFLPLIVSIGSFGAFIGALILIINFVKSL